MYHRELCKYSYPSKSHRFLVPKPAALVDRFSLLNAVLKWGEWFQSVFDQERRYASTYTYAAFTKLWKLTNKWMFKEEISAWNVGVSCGLSSPVSNGAGGDARVSECYLNKSSTEVWRDKDLFSSFRISLKASILLVPCTVGARCSFEAQSLPEAPSVTPSPTVDLETVVVIFLVSVSSPSLPLWFRISRRSLSVNCWSLEFITSKSSYSIVRTNLRDCHNVLRVRAKRRKSGDWCR